MKYTEGISIIEAILFAYGDPITLDRLSESSGIEKETVVKIIDQLDRRYNVSESGLQIMRLNNSFQITTRVEYESYIKKAMDNRRQAPLSQAAMEVLAVVAYNQPVTKGFVEQVRGVDSGSVVNNLVERCLLEEAGRLDLPGRPITYKTTETFLRSFKLSGISELPPIPNTEAQIQFSELEEQYHEHLESGDNLKEEAHTTEA